MSGSLSQEAPGQQRTQEMGIPLQTQDSTTQLHTDNLVAKTRGQRAGGLVQERVTTTGSSKKKPEVLTKVLKFIMIKELMKKLQKSTGSRKNNELCNKENTYRTLWGSI